MTFQSDGETPGSGARCSAKCVTVLSPNPGPDCCSWCPHCDCCNNNNNNNNNNSNNNNNNNILIPPGFDCCDWCPQCDCCSSQGVEGSGGGLEEQLGSGDGSGEESTEDKPSPPPVIKLLTKLLKNLFYIFS